MKNPKMTKNILGAAPQMIAHEIIMEKAESRWGKSDHMCEDVAQMLAPRKCWLVIQEYKTTTPAWWGNSSRFDAYICWEEEGRAKFWEHPDSPVYTSWQREVKRSTFASIYKALEARRLWAEDEDRYWPICECDYCQNRARSWAINDLLDPNWDQASERCPF